MSTKRSHSIAFDASVAAVAPTAASVVFVGPEPARVRAQAALLLHLLSPRAAGPFVRLDGTTLHSMENAHLLLSAAHGGTACVDDVEALSEDQQRALLHCLERHASLDRAVARGSAPGMAPGMRASVRVVSTAVRPLSQGVAEGAIDPDLVARLGAVTIQLPPASRTPVMDVPPVRLDATQGAPHHSSLDEVIDRHIVMTLAAVDGNHSEAARRLGIGRGTLYRRLRALGDGSTRRG